MMDEKNNPIQTDLLNVPPQPPIDPEQKEQKESSKKTLIIIVSIGILLFIASTAIPIYFIIKGKKLAKDAKLAFFKSTVASTWMATKVCLNHNGNILSGRSRAPLCSVVFQTNPDVYWPEMKEDTCEEGRYITYTVEGKNEKGQISYGAKCTISGIGYVMNCMHEIVPDDSVAMKEQLPNCHLINP